MGRLENKVAVVTGAAMGVGEAISTLFAEEGAHVVVADIDHEQARRVASTINSVGGKAIDIALDVSDESAWTAIVSEIVARFGRIDILVNNAGVISRMGLEDCSIEHWEKVQAINSTGVFLGMKTVIPHMQTAGRGAIVNVSSIAGLTGSLFASAGGVAYCASKWAVRGMTKFAANAYASANIRVNSLHPGPTETPMFQSGRALDDERRALIAKSVPLPPHVTDPMAQAFAALFLASDEARFVTGIELACDGGFSSH